VWQEKLRVAVLVSKSTLQSDHGKLRNGFEDATFYDLNLILNAAVI
jgi:hypothetical protein